MPKYNVTFQRTQFYTVKVEAENADEAEDIALLAVHRDGEHVYYTADSKLECTEIWPDPPGGWAAEGRTYP